MTPRRALPALLLCLLSALLVLSSLSAPARADGQDPQPVDPAVTTNGDGTDADEAEPTREEAEEALAAVEEIVEDAEPVDADPATTPAEPAEADATLVDEHGTDLTLALRDLAVSADALSGSDQTAAARLLARPSGKPAGYECRPGSGLPCDYTINETVTGGGVRVHYTDDVGNRNRTFDEDAQVVHNELVKIKQAYAAAGFRSPLSDGTNGGSSDFDIYLADLGRLGLYGYCTADTPIAGHVAAPAYCVLDNNYAEYPYRTPIENLRVTAAHEFFHAVQFAYDVNEDRWFMEGTATWAEDEVFTAINDNRQYLPAGPMGIPGQSLYANKGLSTYGSWIFFRHVSERFPQRTGTLPNVVRRMWEHAANVSSISAIAATLRERGTDLRTQFGLFTLANRRPAQFYSEGAAYRPAPVARSYKMTSGRRTATHSTKLKGLSAQHIRYRSKIRGSWKLKLKVDVANRAKGGYAVVTYKRKGKPVAVKVVKVNRKGKGSAKVKFGSKVKWVEVDLANGGTRKSKSSVTARVVR